MKLRVQKQSGLTKCGELSKKLKDGLKTIHCTLPSCQNFQKIKSSIAHETYFKHIFKIRGAKSTFVG